MTGVQPASGPTEFVPVPDRPEAEGLLAVPLIQAALDRILGSPAFDASQRNREFLRFVVQEVLAGRGDRIKAYAIAVAVFNRDDAFDPQTDPIVRIEASRLRRSLERYYLLAGRDDPVRIDIPKGGYAPTFESVAGPVAAFAPAAPDPAASGAPTASPGEVDGPRTVAPPIRTGRRRIPVRVVTVSLGVLVVLLAALLLAAGDRMLQAPEGSPGSETDRLAAIAARPAILVLPFVEIGPNASDEVLGGGLSERVVQNLIRFGALRVFDARIGAVPGDPLARAASLGADYVLHGTIQRSDDRVRVAVQLVSVGSAASIWGQTLDGAYDIADLFEIEDSISNSVASTLAQPYGVIHRDLQARLSGSAQASVSDYVCLLRSYDYRANFSSQGHAEARACLEDAVVRNPNFDEAWSMLSQVYLDEYRWDFNRRPPPRNPLVAALAAARRAVALDPESASTRSALAEVLFFLGEIDESLAEAERAVALNPNNAEVVAMLALRLIMTGQGERGLALNREAFALNPAAPGWYYFAPALQNLREGDHEAALDAAVRIQMPDFYLQHALLAAVYGHLGRTEEGARAVASAVELQPRLAGCPRGLLAERHLDPPLVDIVMAGLARAGLDVPPDEGARSCA